MGTHRELRFRQVHLDFHTSPMIDGIGTAFDKKLWQERLQMGHVDSITCFSCCHHGWSYHPSKVGAIHPGLNFDLLRAQIDACHEINVNVPIYLTAGVNNRVAEMEPGWREITALGQWASWVQSPLQAGFKKLCFNSPYLDYLCRLIEEAARLFPDADGMFFDIISQGPCCCPYCMKDMAAEGYDPKNEEDRKRFARRTLLKYFRKTTEAARSVCPDFPVFHNNGGLLEPGNRDLLPYFSHLELESLPTGGWGYDHFPLSAAFCRTLEYDFLGMTGKFHTTWGEFGGFKHPNALRYECAAMLAQGAKCSIGDQLHPSGMLDESTCRLIGEAYAEIETKEPWCQQVSSAANVAILSNHGFQKPLLTNLKSEIGLSRLLLEAHIPFDRLDDSNDFSAYKVLILADDLRPDAVLRERLNHFLAQGGKLILSGTSLLKKENDELAFNLPISQNGIAERFPNYIQGAPEFAPDGVNTPFVMYHPSLNIKINDGKSLGEIFEPYFTRDYRHFSSHQHTPNKLEESGYDAGVLTDQILYFAHPVFVLYALYGTVILKDFILKGIYALIDKDLPVHTSLPSQGRLSLLEQKAKKRYVAHALYANTMLRGLASEAFAPELRPTAAIEVIEELNPLFDQKFIFCLPHKIKRVTLEPQGQEIAFEQCNGKVTVALNKLICHQMIVLQY
ncbi:MAG: hypothetical protein WCT05_02755 [Lentisphaeria bacterium]